MIAISVSGCLVRWSSGVKSSLIVMRQVLSDNLEEWCRFVGIVILRIPFKCGTILFELLVEVAEHPITKCQASPRLLWRSS